MSTFCLECAAFVVLDDNASSPRRLLRLIPDADTNVDNAGPLEATSTSVQVARAVQFYGLPPILVLGAALQLANAFVLAHRSRRSLRRGGDGGGGGSGGGGRDRTAAVDGTLALLAGVGVVSACFGAILRVPEYGPAARAPDWLPRTALLAAALHDWLHAAYAWMLQLLLILLLLGRRTKQQAARHRQQPIVVCSVWELRMAAFMVVMVTLIGSLPPVWLREFRRQQGDTGSSRALLRLEDAAGQATTALLHRRFRDAVGLLLPAPLLLLTVAASALVAGRDGGDSGDDDATAWSRRRLCCGLACAWALMACPLPALLGIRPVLLSGSLRWLMPLAQLLYYAHWPVAACLHARQLPGYRADCGRAFCTESCRYTSYVVQQ